MARTTIKSDRIESALTGKSINGVTPTISGSATTYLNGTGTYSTPAGGGLGGTPGGSSTQIQYNNGGSFAGATGVSIQAQGYENLTDATAATSVTTPGSGLTIFNRAIGGGLLTTMAFGDAVEKPLQSHLGFKRFGILYTNMANTTVTSIGGLFTAFPTTAGTAAVGTISSTDLLTNTPRTTYTTAASINSAVYIYILGQLYRGNTTYGGGFTCTLEFGFPTVAAASSILVGLAPSPSGTQTPSFVTNTLFLGKDPADVNLQFMFNDGTGTATKIDLGVPPATDCVYKLVISCKPNSTTAQMTLYKYTLTTATMIYDYLATSNLPNIGTRLSPGVGANTGTTATAVSVAFMSIHAESDF